MLGGKRRRRKQAPEGKELGLWLDIQTWKPIQPWFPEPCLVQLWALSRG